MWTSEPPEEPGFYWTAIPEAMESYEGLNVELLRGIHGPSGAVPYLFCPDGDGWVACPNPDEIIPWGRASQKGMRRWTEKIHPPQTRPLTQAGNG